MNFLNSYRVLSCKPITKPPDLKLNEYGNFTLSGSNLSNLSIDQEIELDIREDLRSKYQASYHLIGLGGVKPVDGQIVVERNQEFPILSGMMEPIQAERVLEAYPDFVQMVLNGEEDKIEHKRIFNVGSVRLESYIDKVKAACNSILFTPVAYEYGVEDPKIIESLTKIYLTPDELKEAFDTNPYHVYIDQVNFPFKKSDRLVLEKHPELIDSLERCEYGCMEILRQNELEGDTRINANLLAALAKELIPEAMEHIVEAVKGCKLMYYDEPTKYSSFLETYEHEKTIADNILARVGRKPVNYIPTDVDGVGYQIGDMDWEPFQNVDGFEMTDEQTRLLQLVNETAVAILTGSAGSGKSFSMKALIRMLEAHNKSYTLLAPTGVAAKKLRESTGRQAYTIHMFLARADLDAGDFVIVDECSMVGVHLMARLFKKIGEEPNIIFVCDEAQLASIECGNIVQDILDSGIVPRANLTKVFRYGEGGIATVATDARFGTFANATKPYPDFKLVNIDDNPIGQVLAQYDDYLQQGYTKEDILILSPFNKGQIGTYAINKAIQQRYNNHADTNATYERKLKGETVRITFKVGDKILNTHNNYHMPSVEYNEDGALVPSETTIAVMNGDIGYVRACKDTGMGPELIVEFDTGLALVAGADIGELLLGYAVSIHKIQGAQAKAVIVVIDRSHKNMLTRNLVYVATSRAQENMTVIGDKDVIESALLVQENQEKDTWLGDMLHE